MNRLAFFVSGNGTNMENLLKEIKAGNIPQAVPVIVISDNPQAPALEKAKAYGVETAVVDRKAFGSKSEFESKISDILQAKKIDWVILAGFMKILSAEFVMHYWGKIINIHPSFLPNFPGAHAIKDAFEAKVKETGVTTHFVTPTVDAGPVILQRKVPVEKNDTLASLETRVHAAEYEVYPETLRLILSGKIKPPPPKI